MKIIKDLFDLIDSMPSCMMSDEKIDGKKIGLFFV